MVVSGGQAMQLLAAEHGAMPEVVERIYRELINAYTDAEQHDTRLAVKAAREHIEADLHAEMRSLRDEIRALKAMLAVGTTSRSPNLTAKANP